MQHPPTALVQPHDEERTRLEDLKQQVHSADFGNAHSKNPKNAANPEGKAAHSPDARTTGLGPGAYSIKTPVELDIARKKLRSCLKLNSVKRKKHLEVKFAPTCRVVEGPNTEIDHNEYWYLRSDLDVFKDERKQTVKALKRNGFDLVVVENLVDPKGDPMYTLRGYECYFSMEINKAFKYTRCLVVSLVKTEQERQKNLRIHNPELIRESSMCASEWARDNAIQFARKDYEEAYPKGVERERQEVENEVRRQQHCKRKCTDSDVSECASSLNRARISD